VSAPGLALRFLGFFFPLTHFGFVGGLFRRIAFPGPGFQYGFGLRQVFQPRLAEGQFIVEARHF
jgi:hypothetical protein